MLRLMHTLLVFCISCTLTAMCRAQGCGREMLSYNFNDRTGPYTNWTAADLWKIWPQGIAREDFRGDSVFPGLIYTKGLERASVGYQHLRLMMPKGCLGTADCGARFVVRLAEEIEEGTLSYRFKFGEEYGRADNWTEGGKLPGMADEDAATACGRSKDVSGTGSFVARTMWRLGGRLMSYMYVTPTEDECVNGEDWWYNKTAESGVWYTMYMYIKLNTPGERNGKHQIWLATEGGEAERLYSKTDVYYRSIQGHGIAKLKFESFHGGSDFRWSPTTDRYIYFDDLKIREGLCVDPGLDLFAQEASQTPITQLGDSFTGSYSRSFGENNFAEVGSSELSAKVSAACTVTGKAQKRQLTTPDNATTTIAGEYGPCGDPNAVVTPVREPEVIVEVEESGVESLSRYGCSSHFTAVLVAVVVTLLHL